MNELFNLALRLLEVMAPVITVAAVGFFWVRAGKPFNHAMVSGLVMNFGAPALVFHTLVGMSLDGELMGAIGLAVVLGLAANMAIGAVGLRASGLPVRDFLPSLMFPNIGNLGLPLCLFAFGEHGLAVAVLVFAVVSIGFWTIGVWLSSREPDWRGTLKIPLIWAVAAGLFINTNGIGVPGWLGNSVELLGQFTIPLMVMTLGASLSTMRVKDLRRSIPLGIARVWGGAGIALLLSEIVGLSGIARAVFVLQFSMPTAVFCFLMAQENNRSPGQVAGVVMVSTVTAFFTLPFLVTYLWAGL